MIMKWTSRPVQRQRRVAADVDRLPVAAAHATMLPSFDAVTVGVDRCRTANHQSLIVHHYTCSIHQ